jgi:hypothetical protein
VATTRMISVSIYSCASAMDSSLVAAYELLERVGIAGGRGADGRDECFI